MRHFVLFCLLIVGVVYSSQAQKVKVKKDHVYVDGDLYCKIETIGVPVRKITIKSLDDEELFFCSDLYVGAMKVQNLVNDDDAYYLDIFALTGVKNKLISVLYNNKVIEDNKISEAGLSKMLMKYQLTEEEAQRKREAKSENRTIVTSGNGTSSGGNANGLRQYNTSNMQSTFVSGKSVFFERDSETENGKIYHTIRVYDNEGYFVGTGRWLMNSKSGSVVSEKDNKSHSVSLDGIGRFNKEKDVIRFLINRLYLK